MEERTKTELSRDLIFDILSNVRRRYVLFHLSQESEPVPLQELSRQIAAWENDIPVEDVSKKQQKRVYVSLYQTHIPKLEQAEIVEYDDDDGTIRLTNRAAGVTAYLEEEEDEDPRWSLYFLGLSLLSAVLLTLVTFDVSVFVDVSEQLLSVVIVGAFALLSLAYFVWRTGGPQGVLRRYNYQI